MPPICLTWVASETLQICSLTAWSTWPLICFSCIQPIVICQQGFSCSLNCKPHSKLHTSIQLTQSQSWCSTGLAPNVLQRKDEGLGKLCDRMMAPLWVELWIEFDALLYADIQTPERDLNKRPSAVIIPVHFFNLPAFSTFYRLRRWEMTPCWDRYSDNSRITDRNFELQNKRKTFIKKAITGQRVSNKTLRWVFCSKK